jgi:hypothetical protein
MKKTVFFSLFAALSLNFSLSHAASDPYSWGEINRQQVVSNFDPKQIKAAFLVENLEGSENFYSLLNGQLTFIPLNADQYRCFGQIDGELIMSPYAWRLEKDKKGRPVMIQVCAIDTSVI